MRGILGFIAGVITYDIMLWAGVPVHEKIITVVSTVVKWFNGLIN